MWEAGSGLGPQLVPGAPASPVLLCGYPGSGLRMSGGGWARSAVTWGSPGRAGECGVGGAGRRGAQGPGGRCWAWEQRGHLGPGGGREGRGPGARRAGGGGSGEGEAAPGPEPPQPWLLSPEQAPDSCSREPPPDTRAPPAPPAPGSWLPPPPPPRAPSPPPRRPHSGSNAGVCREER